MDKATETARENLKQRGLTREIYKRLKEKEFIARCNAVKMCYMCGKDWENIEVFSSHHVSYACPNKKCSEYNKVKRHIYPNRREDEDIRNCRESDMRRGGF